MRFTSLATACAALTLSSCMMGPNYKRPVVDVPTEYRGADSAPAGPSLADQKWFDLFEDDVLKNLVETALEQADQMLRGVAGAPVGPCAR